MKNIFFTVLLMVCGSFSAQELVWENTFDAPTDLTGWTLHDIDGNGNNWVQGKNWYMDANDSYKTKEGTAGVLRYSIGNLDGTYVTGYDNENNWIISPMIDLTGASGKIELAISWNKKNPRTNGVNMDIYISESSDLSKFQEMSASPSDYYFYDGDTTLPSDLNQFGESIIDISAFAGKKIYLGLPRSVELKATPNDSEINIDNMAIYAEKVLATTEVKAGKNLTKVAQNPVAGALMLQLNPNMAEAKTIVQVYNVAGQQVLNAKYSREISVAQLAPGMYIARVTDGNLTETVKFIKK